MTGHANLRLAPQDFARFSDVAIALPKVDAIGLEAFCKRHAVVDDEGTVVRRAEIL